LKESHPAEGTCANGGNGSAEESEWVSHTGFDSWALTPVRVTTVVISKRIQEKLTRGRVKTVGVRVDQRSIFFYSPTTAGSSTLHIIICFHMLTSSICWIILSVKVRPGVNLVEMNMKRYSWGEGGGVK